MSVVVEVAAITQAVAVAAVAVADTIIRDSLIGSNGIIEEHTLRLECCDQKHCDVIR